MRRRVVKKVEHEHAAERLRAFNKQSHGAEEPLPGGGAAVGEERWPAADRGYA